MRGKFSIDLIEFCILTEACIPPVPIARATFFESVSNDWYHAMRDEDRKYVFDWITKSNAFSLENEDCRHFFARYNPRNQYLVDTEYEGSKNQYRCYMFNGKFHTDRGVSIIEDMVVKSKKIE